LGSVGPGVGVFWGGFGGGGGLAGPGGGGPRPMLREWPLRGA